MEAAGKRYLVYDNPDAIFRIWDMADLHEGNAAMLESRLEQDIADIRDDPYSFWLGGGDYADYIGLTDRRFDPEVFAEWVKVKDLGQLGWIYTERVRQRFKPIQGKCLGLLEGNHETAYQRHMQQQQWSEWLAQQLGVASLGYCCFLDLVFIYAPQAKDCPKLVVAPLKGRERFMLRIYAHHGAGYAQTMGGKLKKLGEFMDNFDADLTFVSHIHDQHIKPGMRLRADETCTQILELYQLGIVTGSYLRSYPQGKSTYAEKKGYRPVVLGAVCAKVQPHKRRFGSEVWGKAREGVSRIYRPHYEIGEEPE